MSSDPVPSLLGTSALPRIAAWGLTPAAMPDVVDVLEARAEIETIVAVLAAVRAQPADVAALRERLELMRRAGDDVAAYAEADVAFHVELARASGNAAFVSLVASLRTLLQVLVPRLLDHAGETASSLAVHQPILDAVAAGDPVLARTAMRAHMDRAERRMCAMLGAGCPRGPSEAAI